MIKPASISILSRAVFDPLIMRTYSNRVTEQQTLLCLTSPHALVLSYPHATRKEMVACASFFSMDTACACRFGMEAYQNSMKHQLTDIRKQDAHAETAWPYRLRTYINGMGIPFRHACLFELHTLLVWPYLFGTHAFLMTYHFGMRDFYIAYRFGMSIPFWHACLFRYIPFWYACLLYRIPFWHVHTFMTCIPFQVHTVMVCMPFYRIPFWHVHNFLTCMSFQVHTVMVCMPF